MKDEDWVLTNKKKTIKNKEALKDIVIAKEGERYFYLPETIEDLRNEIVKRIHTFYNPNEKSDFCDDEYSVKKIIDEVFGVKK